GVCSAVRIYSSTIDFIKCMFKNNETNYHGPLDLTGGAFYLAGSKVDFYECGFFKNKVVNSHIQKHLLVIGSHIQSYSWGGAIYNEADVELKIINCEFNENSAYNGNDIYSFSSNVQIVGKEIDYNNVKPTYVEEEQLKGYIATLLQGTNIPSLDFVSDLNSKKEIFSKFFFNGLIDILENEEDNAVLRKNFSLEKGFNVEKICNIILNGEFDSKIGEIHFNREKIYNSFLNGEAKISPQFVKELFLNCDKKRADLTPYDERILEDINRGHWDLWENNSDGEFGINLETPFIARNPEEDINEYGTVAIDFGTKSTVVAFQKDQNKTYIKRIGNGDLEKDVSNNDYENPTLIEFRNLTNFLENYRKKLGRPDTQWEDVTVSYTAFNSLLHGNSRDYYSVFTDLKQWAGKGKLAKIRDKQGNSWDLPKFKDLDLEDENTINPIELYAYYVGLAINNMHGDGIFMNYLLSFPVKFEEELCEKIRYSFEKGLKKSLPISILNSEKIKDFKVKIGASEPAAYAVCALQEYGFEPEGDEKIFYGIFDFGGGTTDFDFGIWREPKRSVTYDFEIKHFYANGDRYLGGENLLQLLAFEIFKSEDNQKTLRDKKITFILPPECDKYPGSETLIMESQEAELNMRILMEECRYFWEHNTENFVELGKEEEKKFNAGVLTIGLYATNGEIATCELNLDVDKLKKVLEDRIDKGVKNFFESWRIATANVKAYEKFHIFLAGNSSKSILVKESFEKHIGKLIEEAKIEDCHFKREDFEIFPPLGTDEAKEIQERRGGSLEDELITPTGKTGVVYGLIRSRESGKIKVINHNVGKIKYFFGIEKRRKFRTIVDRDCKMNSWI
ncbi:MAG: hypothetical protein ACRC0R_04745, partial [Cetobacterium sp.]